MVDLAKLQDSSLFPGLQNIGTSSATATISGTIPASGVTGGNLIGSFLMSFPFGDVISVIRVTLPDAHGELATNWFPVIGSAQLYDATSKFYVILSVQSNLLGRLINFDILNDTAVNQTLTNFRIQAYAHLYTYPWSPTQLI